MVDIKRTTKKMINNISYGLFLDLTLIIKSIISNKPPKTARKANSKLSYLDGSKL